MGSMITAKYPVYTRFCSVTELQTGVFSITSWFNNGASGPLRLPDIDSTSAVIMLFLDLVWLKYLRYCICCRGGFHKWCTSHDLNTKETDFCSNNESSCEVDLRRIKKANLVLTLETSRKFSNAFMLRFLFSAMLLELTLCKL